MTINHLRAVVRAAGGIGCVGVFMAQDPGGPGWACRTRSSWTGACSGSWASGLLVVRSGKGDVYREVPLNKPVREVLELVKTRSAAFVGDWLAPPEARMAAAPASERDRLVNLVWTAKEAAAKVRREGLRLDLRHAVAELSDTGECGRRLASAGGALGPP